MIDVTITNVDGRIIELPQRYTQPDKDLHLFLSALAVSAQSESIRVAGIAGQVRLLSRRTFGGECE